MNTSIRYPSAPKALGELYCVCDPDGNLDFGSLSLYEQDAIVSHMQVEGALNWLGNQGRAMRGESLHCLPSWEQYEAEGYRVVPVRLEPV